MINKGIVPSMHSYTKLVDTLCKIGSIEVALSVVRLLIRSGKYPDAIIYNVLMHGYCLQGQMREAVGVFKTMLNMKILPTL